jgi:hypothetical protein
MQRMSIGWWQIENISTRNRPTTEESLSFCGTQNSGPHLEVAEVPDEALAADEAPSNPILFLAENEGTSSS